jgi:hypothetical protein
VQIRADRAQQGENHALSHEKRQLLLDLRTCPSLDNISQGGLELRYYAAAKAFVHLTNRHLAEY